MPPPSEATASLAIAEAARRTQVRLRAEMVRDVTRAWAVLDFDRLKQTWPAWLQVTTSILNSYHARSADDGALLYRATRQLELGDPGSAQIAAPPSPEWTSKALGYAAPGIYNKQTRKGASPEQANRSALTQTLGTSSRIILDGSHTTIVESAAADPKPVGWYFTTDADPCYFCALLASRGIVYREDSFADAQAGLSRGQLKNGIFTGDGKFKVHNSCGCILAPAFSRAALLPKVNQDAQKIYDGRGRGDAMNAFRRDWEARALEPDHSN